MNEWLKNRIISANIAYRVGNPIINDTEYDALLEQYKNECPNEYYDFRCMLDEGFLNAQGDNVKHTYVAGSLEKLKYEEPENVLKFLTNNIKTSLHVSAKIDGLSGILTYKNGKYVCLATRGNGYEGVDITDKGMYVKNIPHTIDCTDDIVIRGELVIEKCDYDKFDGSSKRNIVTGVIKRKECVVEDLQAVTFVPYTIMGEQYTKREQFEKLEQLGFKTAWHTEYTLDEINAEDFVDVLYEVATRNFDYTCDGLVLSDSTYKNENVKIPDHQMAFKTNTQTVDTKLISVEWQGPSKSGRFNPVGILDPVEIGGVIVSKCTLNNLDFIERTGVKNGSIVSILRSGDVIPKMIRVVESDDNCTTIEYPSVCTSCGTDLERIGPFLYCKNDDCTEKTTRQLELFKDKLNIMNLGFKTLMNLKIHSIEDLLKFVPDKRYKAQTNITSELNLKMFRMSYLDLFYRMNFDDLAIATVSKIVEYYSKDILWNCISVADGSYTLNISIYDLPKFYGYPVGVAEATYTKFCEGFSKAVKYTDMIVNDPRYVYDESKTTKEFVKKTDISVCFTGPLVRMGRNQASSLAESKGWTVKSGVSKGLTYLVTNETTMTTKMKKALDLKIQIINEDKFFELMNSDIDCF